MASVEIERCFLAAKDLCREWQRAAKLGFPVPAALPVAAKAGKGSIRNEVHADIDQAGLLEKVRQLAPQVVVEAEGFLGGGEPTLHLALQAFVGRVVGDTELIEIAADDAPARARHAPELFESKVAPAHPLQQVLGPDLIEGRVVERQVKHVAGQELDIAELLGLGLSACEVDVLGLTIDTGDSGVGYCMRNRARHAARSATRIQHGACGDGPQKAKVVGSAVDASLPFQPKRFIVAVDDVLGVEVGIGHGGPPG